MTKDEQDMSDMGCPECGSSITLYNTDADGKGGMYRCNDKKCGRDTMWKVGKAETLEEMLKKSFGV